MAKKDRTGPAGTPADPEAEAAAAAAAAENPPPLADETTASATTTPESPRDEAAPPPEAEPFRPAPEPEPVTASVPPVAEEMPRRSDEPTPRSAARLLGAGLLGGITGAVLVGAAVIWSAPLSEINERLSSVENGIGNTASRRALETAERRIAALETRAETARQEAERPAPAPAPAEIDIAPLVDRIGRLDQAIGAGRERLDRIERMAADRPVTIGPEAARLSVALLVREKLRAGATVPAELASLEALGTDGALLGRVRDFARAAPPAPARLAADFEQVAPDIVRSGSTGAGFGDRLTAALSNAVKIRRTDEPAAKDTGDPLDAIRIALRNDDPAEAERLWRGLPAAAQDASREWGRAVAARAAAVSGADALVAAAVDGVALAARNAGARR